MRPLLLLALNFQMLFALRGQTGAILPATASPAETAIFFKNYTTREGLPHGLVNLIFEDSRGFLWLSAQTGLARFDGFSFEPIFGEGSGKTIIYSEVLSMAEDAAGQIWASTNDGRLLHFGRFSTDFSVAMFDSLAPRGFILKTERDSVLLIGPNGLIYFQPSTGHFSKISWAQPVFENEAARRAGLPLTVLSFAPDGKGNLWLTGENPGTRGLYRWNMAANRWAYFPYSTGSIPSSSDLAEVAHHIFVDATDGAIYCFGWSGGLRRFLPVAQHWETFYFGNLDKNGIHFVVPKNERELWLGTERGISVFDKKTRRARDWKHVESDPNSLLPARKVCCCLARNGSIWVGGTDGVSCIDPSLQTFARRDVLPPDEKLVAFFKDTLARRMLWATASTQRPQSSIFCADESRPGQKAKLVLRNPALLNVVTGFVLRDRHRDFYWVGSEKGLFKMDAKTFSLRHAEPKVFAGQKPFHFSEISFRTGKFDPSGTLWLGTFGCGVLGLDAKTRQWQQWLPKSKDPSGFFVREILCDQQGRVWAGSLRNDGLSAFDPVAGRDFRLDTTAAWRQAFHDKTVSGLAEGIEGDIWAGTSAGLVRCRLSRTGVFEAEKIGQLSEAVFYLAFDASGRLWMKTNSGLKRLDPRTGSVEVFNERNGLTADFSFGRFYRADDGEFFFGENYRWRPEDIAPKTEAVPQVTITAVRLFDQPLSSEKWVTPGQILQLMHRENALVFEFSALNMNQPAACRYHWQLRGPVPTRTNDSAPGEHRATFNNLPPGDYQFEVWADSGPSTAHRPLSTVLAFRIAPPFWATWWFRALTAVLGLAIVGFFYQNRLKAATAEAGLHQKEAEMSRKEAEHKRSLAEMEIAALRAQMNPHFLFNSLGTLESFIAEQRTTEATEMLQKFSRLTRLVFENSARPLVSLDDDLCALRLYIELELARFENSFTVEWDLDADVLGENPNVPPLLVQPFAENAILHGLRNKKEGDKWLKISLRREAEVLVFEIADNGVGRKMAAQFSAHKMRGQRSQGGRLTARRIQLLNQTSRQTASVRVQDLLENGAETGTRVELRLAIFSIDD